MKKIILSCAVIVIFAGYAIYQNSHSAPVTVSSTTFPTTPTQTATTDNFGSQTQTASGSTPPATITQTHTIAGPPAATTKAPTPVAPTPTPVATKPAGQYNDGTYTGPAVDAFYGTVQVAAVISGGKLTDVQILQYPSDRGHSAELSQASLPQLRTEAITAQSANVQIYSGATQTSEGFIQSLQTALSQAKA